MKKRKKKEKIFSNSKTYRRYYHLIKKIKEVLNSDDYSLKFKRLKDAEGKTGEDNVIFINPQTNLLSTLIHEALHEIYPDLKEKEILKKEKFVFKHLSPTHAKQLVTIIFNLLE